MSIRLKPLVTVGIMLCVVGEGFAQSPERAGDSSVGTAYEFSGLTKYFTVPSKALFGNKDLLKSDIVDGYRVDLTTQDLTTQDWECIQNEQNIVLTSRPVEWWRLPIYEEIDLEKIHSVKAIVVLNPSIKCTKDISSEKFVVDETIAQKLHAMTSSTSDEN